MITKNPKYRPLVYGHRGARGLAPENSLPGYEAGLKIGVDYIDIDVGMSKDGVIVATHNTSLNPNITRDANGNWISTTNPPLIKDLTLKQIKTYNVGQIKPESQYAQDFPEQKPLPNVKIPTLQEVIEFIKANTKTKIGLQIEIKTNPTKPEQTFAPLQIAEAVIKILDQEHVINTSEIQAFDWRVLRHIQKLNPNIATAYLTYPQGSQEMLNSNPEIAGKWSAGFLLKDYQNSIPLMIKSLGGKIWGPESIELNSENLAEAHNLGLKVATWKVNSYSEIERMLDLKVDGIISDYPNRVIEVLENEMKSPD